MFRREINVSLTMKQKINWGIIGPGKIARKFAYDLQFSSGGSLYAIASRSRARLDQFHREFPAYKQYDQYELMLADPDVDAVYIATPHSHHCDHALLAIDAISDAAVLPEHRLLVVDEAHELVARVTQAATDDDEYEAAADAKALRWLTHDHRIPPATEARLRAVIASHDHDVAELVPTHGDWHTRNWLIDSDKVAVIDLGRAEVGAPHTVREIRFGITPDTMRSDTVTVIDLGRADWRPAITDFARLARREWAGRPDLEDAFLEGYGNDPRRPGPWRATLLREAVGTAVWAYQVGDLAFEEQGHRMIAQALELYV